MSNKKYINLINQDTDQIFERILRRRAVHRELGPPFTPQIIGSYRKQLKMKKKIRWETKVRVLLAYGYVPMNKIRWT